MTEDVTLTIADTVAKIVLNRPHKLNAVTPQMAATLEELCAQVDRDDTVRAVLIKGAGERAFSAGSDLNSLAQYPAAWKFRNRVEYATAVRMALSAPLDAGRRYENELNTLCFAAGDHLEGIKAFAERRPAQFER